MIILKSLDEIEKMRASGKIAVAAMEAVVAAVRPGISTKALDKIALEVITKSGAKASFKGYNGFPGAICASVNDEVVHGIPGKRRLEEGVILSIDLGAIYHGYHSAMARTVPVGKISPEAQNLIDVTRESFYRGIAQALAGNHVSDIGRAVQEYAESHGMGVVRELVGHGVGQNLHEAPDVPNYAGKSKGPRLRAGMTIAVEPMINLGTEKVTWDDDGWTVHTADGKLSAHYENTIAITEGESELLTVLSAF